jgi:hypothetical protein
MIRKTFAIWLLFASFCCAWNQKYVTDAAAGGGDGSIGSPWTLAEAITNAVGGDLVNIQSDGSYDNTTTDRTFATAGTTGGVIWWRGYNATVGDLANVASTTDYPAITFTTGRFNVTGAFQWFSNLNISGAQVSATSGQVMCSGADCIFYRCAGECTAANANSNAWLFTGARTRGVLLWGKATSSAYSYMLATDAGGFNLIGCHAEGGATGFRCVVAGRLISCVSDTATADGIFLDATGNLLINCTVYNPGSDGIESNSTTEAALIVNPLIWSAAAYGVNASAGTNGNITIVNPAWGDNTTANTNGILETQVWGTAQALSGDPFTNAASDDFSIGSSSEAKGTGTPGAFENESYIGYPDIGAVQRQEGAAASVGNINPFSNPAIR